MTELSLTLWGGSAETFNPEGNPVIAVKGCKVSDFSGVSLSALSSSVIQYNPDVPKCHALKGKEKGCHKRIHWISRFNYISSLIQPNPYNLKAGMKAMAVQALLQPCLGLVVKEWAETC